MGTIDRYTDDLTIKLSSGKTLTFDADTVSLTGNTFSTTGSLTISTGAGDINLNPTANLDINAVDLVCTLSDDYTLIADQAVWLVTNFTVGASGSSSMMFSNGADGVATMHFRNTSTDPASNLLRLTTFATAPDETTEYVLIENDSGDVKGRIRGAATSTSAAYITDGTSGDATAYGTTPDLVEVSSSGDAVYASGGADYGEWVKAGDLSEWPSGIQKDKTLGIPEGFIVYVRGGAFYKEGPGTPMVVSHRSIVVGNERDEKDFVGQVLSFLGQVPMYVHGPVKSGDYLIPSGSYFAHAIAPSEITFKDYMRVIGTAWEASEAEGMSRVMCSVGIKTTH